jgi:predicted small integral membrane protein
LPYCRLLALHSWSLWALSNKQIFGTVHMLLKSVVSWPLIETIVLFIFFKRVQSETYGYCLQSTTIFNFYVGILILLYQTWTWLNYSPGSYTLHSPFFVPCHFLMTSCEPQSGQCGTGPGSTPSTLDFLQHRTIAQHSFIINL